MSMLVSPTETVVLGKRISVWSLRTGMCQPDMSFFGLVDPLTLRGYTTQNELGGSSPAIVKTRNNLVDSMIKLDLSGDHKTSTMAEKTYQDDKQVYRAAIEDTGASVMPRTYSHSLLTTGGLVVYELCEVAKGVQGQLDGAVALDVSFPTIHAIDLGLADAVRATPRLSEAQTQDRRHGLIAGVALYKLVDMIRPISIPDF